MRQEWLASNCFIRNRPIAFLRARLTALRLEHEMAELAGSAVSLADFIWKTAGDLWGDFKRIDGELKRVETWIAGLPGEVTE